MESIASNKAAQMREHIDQRINSGQTVATYCEQQGISVASYYYWQQKLKLPPKPGNFIKLQAAPSMNRVEVVLPNGIRICFDELVAVSYLNEILCSI